MNTSAQLIAIDWGSSRFRAYLLDRDYSLLEKIETDDNFSLNMNIENFAVKGTFAADFM